MPKTLEEIQEELGLQFDVHRKVFHGDLASDWQTGAFYALRIMYDLYQNRKLPECGKEAVSALQELVLRRESPNVAIRAVHKLLDEHSTDPRTQALLARVLEVLYALKINEIR